METMRVIFAAGDWDFSTAEVRAYVCCRRVIGEMQI